MLNSFVLCCNFCACKCACTVFVRSPGGGGGRHLVTVPQGVVGDCLPWGGEQQGAGGGTTFDPRAKCPHQLQNKWVQIISITTQATQVHSTC